MTTSPRNTSWIAMQAYGKRALCGLAVVVALAAFTSVAFAEDRTGTVRTVYLDQDNYKALRVKLNAVNSFCDGGALDQHIAFLARDSPVYDAALSALLAALYSGQEVMVRSSREGAYCRITQVHML